MLCTAQNLMLLAQSRNSPILNGQKHQPKNGKQPATPKRNVIVENISNWTLYDLKIAQADVLYRDFMELAANHIPDSPKIYAHLLSEAHTILRIAKEICFDCDANKSVSSTMRNAKDDVQQQQIEKLFFESCQKLADFLVV